VPIARISAIAADCSGKKISWKTSAAPSDKLKIHKLQRGAQPAGNGGFHQIGGVL
jgi:hypothetical protein